MTRRKVICFNALFDYTFLYLEIAKKLGDRYTIVWYCGRDREYEILISHGVAPKDICVLHKVDDLAETQMVPLTESVFTASSIYSADRFLKNKSNHFKRGLLASIEVSFNQFLKEHHIDLVMGEPVNAVDLAVVNICASHGVPYLFPQTARMPSDFFIFELFDGSGEAIKNSSGPQGLELTPEDINRKPDYFFLNDGGRLNDSLAFIVKNFKNMVSSRESSYIRYSSFSRLTDILFSYCKTLIIKNFIKFEDIPSTGVSIFFPLHVQPELAIDVLSPVINDQFEMIKILSKAAPDGYTILVKPHSNFLSDFSLNFLRSCTKLHNVRLLSPDKDSHVIIQNCNMVFTFSGTAAYEAFFFSKPAIMLANTFFDKLPNIVKSPDFLGLPLLMRKLKKLPCDYDPMAEFREKISPSLFLGFLGDPFNFPKVMAEENIELLKLAIIDAVDNVSY